MPTLPWPTILLEYVCPSIGVVMAGIMFAAPVGDLRAALIKGSLGSLNPLPWAMMTGNCLGWVAYAYYTRDPFILASNLPGLVMSIWLNMGAVKLQYLELMETSKTRRVLQANGMNSSDEADAASSETNEELIMLPQETLVLRLLGAWSCVLVWVGWIYPPLHPAHIVGLVVNVNLVFFYGAPLQSIMTVWQTKTSDSIHVPTMIMNWANTSFWLAYGAARGDPIIMVPNALGLMLGISMGLLCFWYPRSGRAVLNQDDLDAHPEETAHSLLVV